MASIIYFYFIYKVRLRSSSSFVGGGFSIYTSLRGDFMFNRIWRASISVRSLEISFYRTKILSFEVLSCSDLRINLSSSYLCYFLSYSMVNCCYRYFPFNSVFYFYNFLSSIMFLFKSLISISYLAFCSSSVLTISWNPADDFIS